MRPFLGLALLAVAALGCGTTLPPDRPTRALYLDLRRVVETRQRTEWVADRAEVEALASQTLRSACGATVQTRTALEQWLDEELPPDSVLEQAMYNLVLEFDLPPVEFHPMVLGYEIDFRVTGTPVLIECDGWGSHGLDRNQFEYDRIRNSELVGAGYVLAHVTWSQLRSDRKATAGRIRTVVDRWSRPGIGAASA